MQDPVPVSQFTDLFEQKYSINESDTAGKRWHSLKTALTTFGRKKAKSSDWFEPKFKLLRIKTIGTLFQLA